MNFRLINDTFGLTELCKNKIDLTFEIRAGILSILANNKKQNS